MNMVHLSRLTTKGSIAYGAIYRKENDVNKDSRKITIKKNGTQQKVFDISYEYSKPKNGVLDAVSNKVEMKTSAQSIYMNSLIKRYYF
jgi:hypothetical protein